MTGPSVGLLLARVFLGAYVLAHGLQNLTPWLGGKGIEDTAKAFRAGGLRGGKLAAASAALAQIGAGLLLILGLATPLGAMTVIGVMTVAATVHRRQGFWEQAGGFEYALFLTLIGLVPLWAGPGKWSIDRLLGFEGSLGWSWALVATTIAVASSLSVAAGLHERVAA